jgi:serine protease
VVSGIGPTQSMADPNAVPNQLIVGFGSDVSQAKQLEAERKAKVLPHVIISPHEEVVKTDPRQTTQAAAAALRASSGVRYAVPNLIVRSPSFTPNDRGTSDFPAGWRIPQWNFMATNGVNAIGAWAQAAAAHRSGASGVTIALIDTGVAFTNHDSFRLAPDLAFSTFTSPWDFIYNNPWPLDRNGHGTFLAGTIAETTNNFAYMTGLAWGAKIMPL